MSAHDPHAHKDDLVWSLKTLATLRGATFPASRSRPPNELKGRAVTRHRPRRSPGVSYFQKLTGNAVNASANLGSKGVSLADSPGVFANLPTRSFDPEAIAARLDVRPRS